MNIMECEIVFFVSLSFSIVLGIILHLHFISIYYMWRWRFNNHQTTTAASPFITGSTTMMTFFHLNHCFVLFSFSMLLFCFFLFKWVSISFLSLPPSSLIFLSLFLFSEISGRTHMHIQMYVVHTYSHLTIVCAFPFVFDGLWFICLLLSCIFLYAITLRMYYDFLFLRLLVHSSIRSRIILLLLLLPLFYSSLDSYVI